MSINNTSKPIPKKNNNKLIAEIIIAVVLGTVGAIVIWHYVMDINSSSEGTRLTVDQITDMCVEKLRGMLDSEPSRLSVNVCVGTVLEGMNK
jgi:hypothetical protein